MRYLAFGLLAFLLGLVVGWVAAAAVGLGYMEFADVFDRDGGISMGIVFGIGPLVGIACGALAAIVTIVRMCRRRTATADTAPLTAPLASRRQRIAIGIVAGALFGYFGARGLMWLNGPLAFQSYYVALAVSLAPLLATVAFAALGWWLASGRRGTPSA